MRPNGIRTPALAMMLAATVGLLTGCNPQGPATKTDQSQVCTFGDLQGASHCKDGELAFFSPDIYGNESLPITVIAAYCNTNRPVYFNKAGVVCTFTDKRGLKALIAQPASAPQGGKP